MADIYPKARRVISWLGTAANDSSLALETMKHLTAKIEVDWNTSAMSWALSEASGQYWADLSANLPYYDRTRYALGLLFQRPWFGRLWILGKWKFLPSLTC